MNDYDWNRINEGSRSETTAIEKLTWLVALFWAVLISVVLLT